MKILRVTKEKNEIPKIWKEYGIDVDLMSPHFLSAFTANKIARVADQYGCKVVEVYNTTNAIAAVSARKIAKGRFAIVCSIPANREAPKGIAVEIRREVDAWVFTSHESAADFPTDLKNKTVIPATHFGIDKWAESRSGTPQKYLYIGPLTDFDRLRQAIADTDNAPDGTTLRICGTGKARYVMAEVHHARHISHPERIVWLGEGYDLDKEAYRSDAAIKSHRDITDTEAYIMSHGLPLYERIGGEEKVEREQHMPCFHVEQFKKLYTLIRQ